MAIVKKEDFKDADGIPTLKFGQRYDPAWGARQVAVTTKDISNLLAGKVWYLYDGEYVTLLALSRQDEVE